MVFLRLTVKVFPRDQTPASNTFSLRSFLGDRDRDDSNRNASGTAAGKPASFLIVLENPEDVTLGGLAGMIKDKWEKLRPLAEPLEIKKLVDDEHESDDLDADMTVAEVFVDNGKARSDGLDQRRVVRVIQKPANGDNSPVRLPSVTQDWDEAAEKYELQRRIKKEKHEAEQLETIAEESRLGSASDYDSWSDYTPGRQHRKDIPVSSVEKDVEIPVSPTQRVRELSVFGAAVASLGREISSSNRRLASQELGDSPPSSRAPTPKKIPARRESTASQNSVKQSVTGATPAADSPALQLARESFSQSMSPQKQLPPKETRSDHISLDDQTSGESGSEATRESGKSDNSPSELERNEQDEDGDVAMADEIVPNSPEQPASPKKRPTIPTSAPIETSVAGSQSRKRKNSAEQLSPNKEPRLDKATPPPKVNGARRNSQVPGTPKFSPGRRSSFSGVPRQPSFSTDSPKHGLGLGITSSPQKKPQVLIDLSQDTTQSNDTFPNSTPVPPVSAPGRRASLSKTVSTPTNLGTPAEKAKNPHSALRKGTPLERNQQRRSVSFVDGDELGVTVSQPVPTSAPPKATSTPIESRKSTPGSQSTSSETRRISGGSMVFPPNFSQEQIEKYEREAAEKFEKQEREKAEFEDKIKAAEDDNLNANYIRRLRSAYETWKTIQKLSKSARPADKRQADKHRETLNVQQEAIKKHEASMKSAAKGKPSKSSQKLSQKSPESQKSSPEMAIAADVAPTAAASKSTSTAITNGAKTLPVAKTGWNAVNAKPATTGSEPAALKTTSTPKLATPSGFATQIATKTHPGEMAKAASSQSQNSGSDEVELPAMKVQARANAAKKTSPENPIEVSSDKEEDDDEEEGENETSEAESSSSESSSESDSDSESESDEDKANRASASKLASQNPKSASPPSAQRGTKSPAVSQETTSQSHTWGWPAANSQATRPTRASLKSLKGEVEIQAAAKSAPKRTINGPPRKGTFSPDDSEDTESESEESSSSSSSSDDSGDEGDIMSSGQVQKLRPARVR
ncbi:hypothetical protein BJY01DRAFT_227326 [Aspergillus pseudoustus]|uniref:Nucleolar protein Dnt1-like N-terminal domain-containing protein n=1 Tax=Aspergillus pseudoustus TaxID=1810923 RepID=A0ABR4IRH4_9EURO